MDFIVSLGKKFIIQDVLEIFEGIVNLLKLIPVRLKLRNFQNL